MAIFTFSTETRAPGRAFAGISTMTTMGFCRRISLLNMPSNSEYLAITRSVTANVSVFSQTQVSVTRL